MANRKRYHGRERSLGPGIWSWQRVFAAAVLLVHSPEPAAAAAAAAVACPSIDAAQHGDTCTTSLLQQHIMREKSQDLVDGDSVTPMLNPATGRTNVKVKEPRAARRRRERGARTTSKEAATEVSRAKAKARALHTASGAATRSAKKGAKTQRRSARVTTRVSETGGRARRKNIKSRARLATHTSVEREPEAKAKARDAKARFWSASLGSASPHGEAARRAPAGAEVAEAPNLGLIAPALQGVPEVPRGSPLSPAEEMQHANASVDVVQGGGETTNFFPFPTWTPLPKATLCLDMLPTSALIIGAFLSWCVLVVLFLCCVYDSVKRWRQQAKFALCCKQVRRIQDMLNAPNSDVVQCPICIENVLPAPSSEAVVFLCGHRFHLKCANEWQKARAHHGGRCPICNSNQDMSERPEDSQHCNELDGASGGSNGLATMFYLHSLSRLFPEFIHENCVRRWSNLHSNVWLSELECPRYRSMFETWPTRKAAG